ncbi:MAG: hypothetical protein OXU21_06470 [Chloroflexota bacterium]|nr:hypothetical protein [Chloroflexota bacterium]
MATKHDLKKAMRLILKWNVALLLIAIATLAGVTIVTLRIALL